MFNVLISGKLSKPPKSGTGKNGQPYCTASLRVPVQGQREDEPDAVFASVIAFGEDAEKLGRLLQGDAVSVSGSARLSHWEKDGRAMTGLNVTASAILSAYELRKRRGESNERNEFRAYLPSTSGMARQQPAIFDAPGDFNDELAF
jgi:single-strand DNA-binding protein